MSPGLQRGEDLFHLESAVWLWTSTVGVSIYDFAFEPLFACRRPYMRPEEVEVIARVGALSDYAQTYRDLQGEGIRLVHTPDENLRATRLPRWYPLLEGLTPKSLWFSAPPDPHTISEELGWPIFMNGARQTSRHKRSLSIIAGPDELRRALDYYAQDPVLSWQDVVCRELVPLRFVEDPDPERIPSSYEFRSFWWRGELVGIGRYWWEGTDYHLTEQERTEALGVAQEASRRVDVPFLVVDVAQRADGGWIVIECNDGQESGYAGVSPLALWQEVVRIERKASPGD